VAPARSHPPRRRQRQQHVLLGPRRHGRRRHLQEIARGTEATTKFNSGTGRSRAGQMVEKVEAAKIPGSPQLKALIAMIDNYLIMNRSLGPMATDPYKVAADYAKVNTQFLARTDFATMFRLLPEDERTPLEKQGTTNENALVNLVASTFNGVGETGLDMDRPVFERGIKGDEKTREVIRFPLTRRQWIQGIAEGEDKLSGASTYAKTQGYAAQLESMGNISGKAGKLDPVGGETDRKTGIILEFRSKTDPIEPNEFALYIRTTFSYIKELNRRKSGKTD
jgi:hypothetical protein